MIDRLRNIGPGTIVTAAFIGPGTVTACTLAGANFGYALLWAVLFATIATILLQDMAARLGVVTGKGLGANLAQAMSKSSFKTPLFILIGVALYMGNAAYEGGNLSGAALGVSAIIGDNTVDDARWIVLVIASLAAVFLFRGSYWLIERLLIALVLIMILAFLLAVIIVKPDIGAFFRGMLIPSLPSGSIITAIALIGTTIVPYNLFLHAATVKDRWQGAGSLLVARSDSAISIGLGGLITLLVMTTAAASLFGSALEVTSATDMAQQLEPAFGSLSVWVLGIGLSAAGLSSAITAPLATGYAITEIFGINSSPSAPRFRGIALSVLVIGTALAMTGIKPLTIIIAAQVANGLLLPIIAFFLLYTMNRSSLLGAYSNGWRMNLIAGGVVLLTTGIGLRAILHAFDII